MAGNPSGYHDIPEEDRKKAKVFFDRGKSVADTGQYEYAISMYLEGLEKDPEAVDAHQALRDISLKRKASGGKSLGMFERMRLSKPTKDDKQNMLNAERLLAFDPGNTDYMLSLLQNAHRAGYFDTVLWIGPILQKANADGRSPDANKFLILKDVYRSIAHSENLPRKMKPELLRRAGEACAYAVRMREDDMDLQTELKNLGAELTMVGGGYEGSGSFRDSVRDMDLQEKLLIQDKDVRTDTQMQRLIAEAEAEWKADPQEPGKIARLVDALCRTEQTEYENRAIEILQEAHQRTGQFRFRHRIGQIKLGQLNRMERSLRQQAAEGPDYQRQLQEFLREKAEEELAEYTLWYEQYPTDKGVRFQIGRRLFTLGRHAESIPVFQEAKADPKWRVDASIYLGRAFLEAGYTDEAVETLKVAIDDYQLKGDERSKNMHYWYGRALEMRGDLPGALRQYSQVAQWDFNYGDVQGRIKRLRTGPSGSPAAGTSR